MILIVIPAKAGIHYFSVGYKGIDPHFQGDDDFLQ
jgi:hypothetical protein